MQKKSSHSRKACSPRRVKVTFWGKPFSHLLCVTQRTASSIMDPLRGSAESVKTPVWQHRTLDFYEMKQWKESVTTQVYHIPGIWTKILPSCWRSGKWRRQWNFQRNSLMEETAKSQKHRFQVLQCRLKETQLILVHVLSFSFHIGAFLNMSALSQKTIDDCHTLKAEGVRSGNIY